MKIIGCFLLLLCAAEVYSHGRGQTHIWVTMQYWLREDNKSSWEIINMTSDLIKDSDERLRELEPLRLDNFRSASFEVGFLNYRIVELYRKMVDYYNVSVSMSGQLYPIETVQYLYEIESFYWEIIHFVKMQHEIERKYRHRSSVKGRPGAGIHGGAAGADDTGSAEVRRPAYVSTRTRRTRRTRTRKIKGSLGDRGPDAGRPKKESTRWWWPIEYGWEIETYW